MAERLQGKARRARERGPRHTRERKRERAGLPGCFACLAGWLRGLPGCLPDLAAWLTLHLWVCGSWSVTHCCCFTPGPCLPYACSCRLLWAPVGSCGLLLAPVGSCGLLRAPVAPVAPVSSCGLLVGFCGVLWAPAGSCGLLRIVASCGVGSYGLLWAPMGSCGLLWAPAASLRAPVSPQII